jgi:hypothetical protein
VGNLESFANLFLQQTERKHDLGKDTLKSVKPTVPPVEDSTAHHEGVEKDNDRAKNHRATNPIL